MTAAQVLTPQRALFRLDDKVAVVTGAAGHLGKAIATGLAEVGGHVCLVGRTEATVAALAKELTGRGLKAEAQVCDVTKADQIKALVDRLGTRWGRLDVLVNNAHAGRAGVMADSHKADYVSAIEIAVAAAAELVNEGHALLKAAAVQNGDAAVINISSMYGMVSPDPRVYGASKMNNPPHYGAAKAALLQYTRYAACHLAPDGIRVNAISPGPFPPDAVCERDPAFCGKLIDKVPMGRLGKPGDLMGAAVFLASPASSFVTGANLPVDGGWTAW
ncbi:MAG TPA: SDR family oxidoreductase [Dongiaceae bacterium]|nr:SDR family oxidoreductase [Dongiaceae bacterium]